jgi:hypothetical protein
MAGRIAYYGNISTQGLVLNLDAAIQGSYPKTGSTWFDISNNGNNGTLTNGPLYTGSDYGAIVFDGTNDFVTGSVINTPNQLSVFSFVNPKPRAGSVYPNIISKWSADPGINNRSWVIGILPGGINYILVSSNGTYENNTIKRFEFSSSVSNNIWTQVGFTFNNGTLIPYLNGAPANYTASLNANITSIHTSSVGYTLGYSKDGVFDTYFSGSIANAQIYNQSLSPFQVWQNFNAYKSRYGIPDIVTDGLVLNLDAGNPYSYLSGSSGTTWTNTVAVSSSISGSLVNGTTYSNGAMVFDGVDDYIEVPNNVALNSNIGTISVWFKSTTTAGRSAVLIGKTDSVGSYNGINILTSGTEIYGQVKGSGDQIISGSLLSQNTWYNFTLTYSSGISYSSYLNGSLLGTNTLVSFTFSTQPLRIARSLDSFWTIYKGQVSNAMIYNRALSAAEVQQNFNALRGRYGI